MLGVYEMKGKRRRKGRRMRRAKEVNALGCPPPDIRRRLRPARALYRRADKPG
jgi:hypothetical protein